MTDPLVITAYAGLLTVIIGGVVSIIKVIREHAAKADVKADAIIDTTKEIHKDTNSNLTAVNERLDEVLSENRKLQKLLRTRRK